MRGGAQSHLMRASDGNFYVVKFQNNPQHPRVLVNEWLATRMAERIGLPVATPEILDYMPESLLDESHVRNLEIFPGALAFDKWTCNGDGRQMVYWRKGRERKYTATLIDQGYCFNAGEWAFPDSPLRGVFSLNAA